MIVGRASSSWRSRDVMGGMLRGGGEGWKQNTEGRGLVRRAPREKMPTGRRGQRRLPALFLVAFFAPPFLAAAFFAPPFLAELFLVAFFVPPCLAAAFFALPFLAAAF